MCVRGHKLESLPGAKYMVENIKETKKIGLREGIKPFMANSNVKTNCGVSLVSHKNPAQECPISPTPLHSYSYRIDVIL